MTKTLHYQTASGSTGECAIYTTEEECPAPNLKVQIDGTNGYVKLSEYENNPDNTPIKVTLNSDGKTYWVCKTNATRFTINVAYFNGGGGDSYYGYRRNKFGSISRNPIFGITINNIQGHTYDYTSDPNWANGVHTDPSDARFELYIDGVWVRGQGNGSAVKNYVYNKNGQTLPFYIRTY